MARSRSAPHSKAMPGPSDPGYLTALRLIAWAHGSPRIRFGAGEIAEIATWDIDLAEYEAMRREALRESAEYFARLRWLQEHDEVFASLRTTEEREAYMRTHEAGP